MAATPKYGFVIGDTVINLQTGSIGTVTAIKYGNMISIDNNPTISNEMFYRKYGTPAERAAANKEKAAANAAKASANIERFRSSNTKPLPKFTTWYSAGPIFESIINKGHLIPFEQRRDMGKRFGYIYAIDGLKYKAIFIDHTVGFGIDKTSSRTDIDYSQFGENIDRFVFFQKGYRHPTFPNPEDVLGRPRLGINIDESPAGGGGGGGGAMEIMEGGYKKSVKRKNKKTKKSKRSRKIRR